MFEPFDFSETPCLAFRRKEGEPDLGLLLGQILLIDIGNGLSTSCSKMGEMRLPSLRRLHKALAGCSRDETTPSFVVSNVLGKLFYNFRIPFLYLHGGRQTEEECLPQSVESQQLR